MDLQLELRRHVFTRAAQAFSLLLLASIFAGPQWAAPYLAQEDEESRSDYTPYVAPASDEAAASVATLVLSSGLSATLFAAEPMLANPVCLYVADDGAVYVGETFRHHAGVTDIREHMDWLDDDLASQTLEDRVAMIAKHSGKEFSSYFSESDRVRVIRDTDGDHVADQSTVFAEGFNHPGAGIGAGLLEYGGSVYYTCIPDLWRLWDGDGDDVAEHREVLSTGYGVNVALLGHDLHGLRVGPDQRLYFSSGDRGFRVETAQGVLDSPKTGAVLRCNLDGSNLEIVHSGLRNPQELVFDEFGNLWTGDNNSDGGDKARWVNIVEGGDSGWRYPYQWIRTPNARGPWNDEKLWHPSHDGQAAYILPPIANLASGPSGLTYNPGTGLGGRWDAHFFLADFRGGRSSSGVHAFTVEPRGAFWELGPVVPFVWNTLVTDCDFGPDGAMYLTDWVEGWNKTGKGRVYRITDDSLVPSSDSLSTQAVLSQGFSELGVQASQSLLGHADMRVRQGAQFRLVELGVAGIEVFTQLSRESDDLYERLHSIWGIGIYARQDPEACQLLLPLLDDEDPEVRAQAIKVLGEELHRDAGSAIAARLGDPHPRVRFFAALATGKLGTEGAVGSLRQLLIDAGDSDPNLRHAAVMGLLGTASDGELESLSQDEDASVRMGALLVQRRQARGTIRVFLSDPDPALVFEAARAINDVPIEPALQDLARVSLGADAPNGLVRRVLNANFRLGGQARAQRVADLALRSDLPVDNRSEALSMLRSWGNPEERDRVTNFWRPLPTGRANDFMVTLVADLGEALGLGMASTPEPERVLSAWTELAQGYPSLATTGFLRMTLSNAAASPDLRVAAFDSLSAAAGESDFGPSIDIALSAADGGLRAAGLKALQRLSPSEALPRVAGILAEGEVAERRAAYAVLAQTYSPEATELLLAELRALQRDEIAQELYLDLMLAAEENGDQALLAALQLVASQRATGSPLTPFLDGLFGGDPQAGKVVFERAELSCLRCHSVGRAQGEALAESSTAQPVGPDLGGLSKRLARLHMLESIVTPNRRTTRGYSGTVLFFADDSSLNGRVLKEGLSFPGEEGTWLQIQDSEGEVHTVFEADIVERRSDLSAMPEGLGELLDRKSMRDLLAYLGSL